MSHPVDPETGDLNLNVIAPVYIRNTTEECPLIGMVRGGGKVEYYITYDYLPANIKVNIEDGYTYEIVGRYIIVVGPGYDLGEDTYPLGVTIIGEIN